jgi:hypothetical protein
MHRVYLAFLCFFRVLFGKPLPKEVVPAPLEAPAPVLAAPKEIPKPEPPKKLDLSPGALQLLGLLQREGRLVDFLCESIDAYDDATIGVAVRDIHRGCRKVLLEHFGVEPVLTGDENDPVTVEPNFDPGKIRLLGNVAGQPPWKGILRHHGWRAAKITLPVLAEGMDMSVVAPAEVELS